MCGRFAASASVEEIVEMMGVEVVLAAPSPGYNRAPTDEVAAVVSRSSGKQSQPRRTLVTLRWGLVPTWAKDTRSAARLINARGETVASKPSFAHSFSHRRCLIPADGYYEWTTEPGPDRRPRKQPWFIGPADGSMWAMAGLYALWRDPHAEQPGPWLATCAIITGEATDAVGHLHERMPMTIRRQDWDAWLDPQVVDPARAQALLWADAGAVSHRVAPLVNRVSTDGPELVAPVE